MANRYALGNLRHVEKQQQLNAAAPNQIQVAASIFHTEEATK